MDFNVYWVADIIFDSLLISDIEVTYTHMQAHSLNFDWLTTRWNYLDSIGTYYTPEYTVYEDWLHRNTCACLFFSFLSIPQFSMKSLCIICVKICAAYINKNQHKKQAEGVLRVLPSWIKVCILIYQKTYFQINVNATGLNFLFKVI